LIHNKFDLKKYFSIRFFIEHCHTKNCLTMQAIIYDLYLIGSLLPS
jgi:hypothetical protein